MGIGHPSHYNRIVFATVEVGIKMKKKGHIVFVLRINLYIWKKKQGKHV